MTFKIAISPNAFRGSLSAIQAAQLIQQGLVASQLNCSTVLMPLADGGDGTLDVWLQAVQGERHVVEVENPVGKTVQAEFGIKNHVALIEMAKASGIELIAKDEQNPLKTSTFGTGQLIQAALDRGATEILIGVGGSATVDGGAGCLQALGAKLLNDAGNNISKGGGNLEAIRSIDFKTIHQKFANVTVKVLCDVDNPLVGKNGAAQIFGPQKGADAAMVEVLEANLTHYADQIRDSMDIRLHDLAGAGAAGGLSAGLVAGTNAEIVSGVNALIDACDYSSLLASENFSLLITGEGKLDHQTAGGKAPLGIAKLAEKYQIPTIAFAGAVDITVEQLQEWYIRAAYSIVQQPCSLEKALENAEQWLYQSALNLGNTLALA